MWREWMKSPHNSRIDMAARLKKIEDSKRSAHEDIPFEQWEVVYRELLQLEDEVVASHRTR
jgi:hypothetical protein